MAEQMQGTKYEYHGGDAGQHHPPTDPNSKLNRLKQELDGKKSEIDHLTKQTTDLQVDITGLEGSIKAAGDLLAKYGQGLKDLQKSRDDIEYFYDQKSKMINAAIGERKEPVDHMVRDYDAHIQHLEGQAEQLKERLDAANEALQEATTKAAHREDAWNKVKSYQQRLQAKLDELKTLRDQITKADEANDAPSMYFLVLDLKALLAHTNIESQQQLAARVNKSIEELEEAREHKRTRQLEAERLQTESDAAAVAVQTAKTGRRAAILQQIAAEWPPK
jgi:chromosome segregation ATPase